MGRVSSRQPHTARRGREMLKSSRPRPAVLRGLVVLAQPVVDLLRGLGDRAGSVESLVEVDRPLHGVSLDEVPSLGETILDDLLRRFGLGGRLRLTPEGLVFVAVA